MFRTVANITSWEDVFLTGDGGRTRYTLKEVILSFIFITLPMILVPFGIWYLYILKIIGE